jgi:hypothetical protein
MFICVDSYQIALAKDLINMSEMGPYFVAVILIRLFYLFILKLCYTL